MPLEARRDISDDWPTSWYSQTQLKAFRGWQNFVFAGNEQCDNGGKECLAAAVSAINTDSSHAGGVRIQFDSGAHYKDLIFMLDLVNRTDVKRYWFDIQHGLPTLYIVNYELGRSKFGFNKPYVSPFYLAN